MRICILLAALAAMELPGFAARHMTVDQLQEFLAKQRAAYKTDSEIAKQIGSVDLTEQLTRSMLDRMEATLNLGPKTGMALDVLADTSSFLDPPASKLDDKPTPEDGRRKSMTKAMGDFAALTLRRLPDFLATRITRSFDNTPVAADSEGWYPPSDILHLTGTFSQDITFRKGSEVFIGMSRVQGAQKKRLRTGPDFTPIGEFGPLLNVVMEDAKKGSLAWSRWQATPTGPVAVFEFEVPKKASHFQVGACLNRDTKKKRKNDSDSLCYTASYHGMLYLDPATGVIRRVILEARFKDKDPIHRAALSVEYAPVTIGNKSCVCPVRSVAIISILDHPEGGPYKRTLLWLDEVRFTNYHRFGSTVEVLNQTPSRP